jgi:hypothetical protein
MQQGSVSVLDGPDAKLNGKELKSGANDERRHDCRRRLLEASVRPTCVFLTESPVELSKAFDPDSGLLLIKL